MSTHQMNFRCDKMLRNILIVKDNYSEFIREACWGKLNREGDQTLLKAEKQDLQSRIKEIDHELKKDVANKDQIKECLEIWYQIWKANEDQLNKGGYGRSDGESLRWIKSKVLSELKKLGYKGTPKDILDKFKDWPD